MARILLIDDDAGGRQMAAFNLRKAGHEVDEAEEGAAGLVAFEPNTHDLVITDVRMPELSGIEVTRGLKERAPEVPVLVVTAYANVDTAVEAMKAGATDFIIKPFSRDQLLVVVDRALEHVRLKQENRELRRRLTGVERPIVFCSESMKALIEMADRVAVSTAIVLITGESGTGKELFARRIHARSQRSEGNFVAVNCAAVPSELIESELFGHEPGAFTGATHARAGRFRQADGGTLFLDEILELPLASQGKLLRVLQEGVVDVLGSDASVHVDVRVVAATNKDLRAAVKEGAFREDLFFRLNVVELQVPPLRQRAEEIGLLVRAFVEELAESRAVTVPDAVIAELERRSWHGNVRELRNACERMVILRTGDVISTDVLLPEGDLAAPELDRVLNLPAEGISLLDLEKQIIERVLSDKGGNISEAARFLQVPRHILVYRIEKYGIRRPPKR